MSEKLPSREQAIQLLSKNQCSLKVIEHCKTVAKIAVQIAEACKRDGLKVNLELVEISALLHDIGRSKTHSVDHAVLGAQILKAAGIPEPVISIVKRHVGGGLTVSEAEKLGWPKDVYAPMTIEEKIVSYADKLTKRSKQVSIEVTLAELASEGKHEAFARVKRLHKELSKYIGEQP